MHQQGGRAGVQCNPHGMANRRPVTRRRLLNVDSQCGSSQFAVNLATNMIASGAEDIVLACGVENMSLLPIGSDAVAGTQAGMGKPITRKYREHFEFTSQFEGAERIATKYGITRSDTDVRPRIATPRGTRNFRGTFRLANRAARRVPVIQEGGERPARRAS